MKTRKLLCLLLLAAIAAIPAIAQTVTASLVGHVSDSSGASVAGVKVVATEATRNVTRETVTNEAGNYTINSVEPGLYRISIQHPGCKGFVKDRVEVTINSTVDRSDLSQQIQPNQVGTCRSRRTAITRAC